MSITTVVVKPRSRGTVRLASANPTDMPLVAPNLLKHPDDMRDMIAGQRFFLRAFSTQSLAARIDKIVLPAPDDLSDETLRSHCKRFVKTNYHPSGTARVGADNDPMAVLDSGMRVQRTRLVISPGLIIEDKISRKLCKE